MLKKIITNIYIYIRWQGDVEELTEENLLKIEEQEEQIEEPEEEEEKLLKKEDAEQENIEEEDMDFLETTQEH